MERGWRDITPNCPRCGSSNTKFCYYNNYSLTQPRYFCKGCRRYWTRGGSLRNVPVGGGCRKSRRSRSSGLRLGSASSHLHHGLTSRSTGNNSFVHDGGHVAPSHYNQALMHNSYSNSPGIISNMVESSTSSINTDTQPIDLAVVYANFLNQKVENNSDSTMVVKLHDQVFPSHEFNNPPPVDFSSVPDATSIVPSSQVVLQVQQKNIMDCSTLSMPQLSNENDHNSMLFADFRPIQHHEDIPMPHELGLPPLPGESTSQVLQQEPWTSTSCEHDTAPQLPNLEPDAQFNNLFIGNWGSIDLPGFDTSSSSSKHC